jgi:hypothetical protein
MFTSHLSGRIKKFQSKWITTATPFSSFCIFISFPAGKVDIFTSTFSAGFPLLTRMPSSSFAHKQNMAPLNRK